MQEPSVNVAITTDEVIEFELHGFYNIAGAERIYSGKYVARIANGKLAVFHGVNSFVVGDEVTFHPSDYENDTIILHDILIGKEFHWEQKEKQRFQGALKLKLDGDKIIAMNIIPVEDYLKCVISSEMNPDASADFLKAHAIISRSWLLAQMEHRKDSEQHQFTINDDEIIKWYDKADHELFDVCADDHCQRYQGITKVSKSVVTNAVESTRGMVLEQDYKICDTRFSKCCGGITEAFENVWQPEVKEYLSSRVDYKFEPDELETDFSKERRAAEWIKTKPSSYCNCNDSKILSQVLVDYDQATNDFYRWKVEYTQTELAEIIKQKSGIDFGEIKDFVPVTRGKSGRLIKLKIVGSKRTMTIGKELEIRRVLSKSHLYSSAIVIEKEEIKNDVPGKFIIFGAGWGHGVGLCQIGAAVMGELGYKFDEILIQYFTGTQIRKLY